LMGGCSLTNILRQAGDIHKWLLHWSDHFYSTGCSMQHRSDYTSSVGKEEKARIGSTADT
jgi:hypothetical protein